MCIGIIWVYKKYYLYRRLQAHKTRNYFIATDCALRCFGLRPKMTFTKCFFPLVFSPKQPSNRNHHNRRRNNIIITRVHVNFSYIFIYYYEIDEISTNRLLRVCCKNCTYFLFFRRNPRGLWFTGLCSRLGRLGQWRPSG